MKKYKECTMKITSCTQYLNEYQPPNRDEAKKRLGALGKTIRYVYDRSRRLMDNYIFGKNLSLDKALAEFDKAKVVFLDKLDRYEELDMAVRVKSMYSTIEIVNLELNPFNKEIENGRRKRKVRRSTDSNTRGRNSKPKFTNHRRNRVDDNKRGHRVRNKKQSSRVFRQSRQLAECEA